jgi:hypothetical protein
MVIPTASTDIQPARTERRRERADDYEDESDYPRRSAKSGTSGKAIAALVFGLSSLGCSFLTGIPAVIFGILGMRDINRSQGRIRGSGIAIAGIVTGIVASLLWIALFSPIFVLVLLPKLQYMSRGAANVQSQNNLRQMALAMHNYSDTKGALPPAAIVGKDGKPLLSWRVAILPYLGEDALYKQFKLDEPWDGPTNIRLLTQMPKVFAHASADPAKTSAGFTHYRVFVGQGTAFDPTLGGRGTRFPGEFPDGTTNTILIVEAADSVEWTKPAELPFSPNGPLPTLGVDSSFAVNVALADGSARQLMGNISQQTLRAAITRNGGEVLGKDW